MEKTMSRENSARRITLIGMAVNTVLLIVKFTLGTIGNSAALVADAFHSLSDFVSDIVVIVGMRFTSKPADKSHNYGHGKIETLTTVFIGIVLVILSFTLLRDAVIDIYNFYVHDEPIKVPKSFVLIAVAVSIVAKEIMFRYTLKVGKSIKSDTIVANAWHQRSDALSSVAALIGISLAVIFGEKFAVADPIASAVVSLLVFKVGFSILTSSFNQLLDASLNDEELQKIKEIIEGVEGIKHYRNIKTRKIGYYISVDIHIEVNWRLNVIEAHDIATELENEILNEFGEETFISVHIEPYNED